MTLQLTTDTGRGQLRLTVAAATAICDHYGWTLTSGYIDRDGTVYIGSNYAGRVDGDSLVLDRDRRARGAPRLAVIA